jgi:hypothetical protein
MMPFVGVNRQWEMSHIKAVSCPLCAPFLPELEYGLREQGLVIRDTLAFRQYAIECNQIPSPEKRVPGEAEDTVGMQDKGSGDKDRG